MATEIATAYVSLVASTKDLAAGARGAFSQVERDAASTSGRVGSSLSSAIGSAFSGLSAGIVGVASAIGGMAAAGGIARALAIDNAQAKMKALGYTGTQVTDVMNTALASVKGTAFGLGDAASLATQLIAAGIKPGNDLARALGNTADLAAVANVNLGDISPVMGQLASSSHLYTQDLLQLQSRGLPVFSWLADSLGTTQSDVRDMVSAGKIDFAQLQTAIEQHIGGAAKATDSFQASWSNVKAALSRSGAVFATPGLAMLKGLFDQAIPSIDAVTAKIQPLVDTLVAKLSPAVEGIATRVSSWIQGMDFSSAEGGLKGLLPVLAPIVGLIGATGGASLAGLFGPLGKMLPTISGPMGLILGLVTAMLAQSPELRAALGGAFESIGAAVQSLAPLLPVVTDLISSLAGTLGGALAAVLSGAVVPLIQTLATQVLPALLPAISAVLGLVSLAAAQFGGLLVQAITALVPPIMQLITALLPVIVQILGALVPVIGRVAIALLPVLVQVIMALAPVVLQVVQAFLPLLPVLGQLIVTLLPPLAAIILAVVGVVVQLIPFVMQLVEAFLPLIPVLLQLVMALLPPLAQLILALAPIVIQIVGVLGALLVAIMPVVMWIADKLVGAISALLGWFTKILPGIIDFTTKGVTAVGDFASKIGEHIGDAIQWFKDLPGKILDTLKGAGTWLVDVGKDIIDGFIDGIKGAFNKVKDALSGLTKLLPDWKGPADVDAKLLTGNGRLIMQSLVAGFEREAPAVQKYLQGFTADLSGVAQANVNVAPGAGSANGTLPPITVYEAVDGDETARRVARRLQNLGA